ncbi:MAG: type II toxin-antitoxin system RelE/ParE family toxin [Chloroflexi bacterium]|nr:type II toxin-antitoxin system RelE/ParE family toxin [Chloroflexota bacterium]MCH9010416.1 type II toxin-antitoxin system RelE/ParE family toxin [Chloroflexota bacterium]
MERLPVNISRRVLSAIESLAEEPRPRGSRKLVGSDDSYRLRVGSYRILYQISYSRRDVTVYAVGHRSDVYR